MSTVEVIQTLPLLTDIDAHRGSKQPQAEMSEGLVISAAEYAELEALAEAVAIGLAEIRDRRLFRKTHKNFAEFAHWRFGLSRSSAYNYIRAARTVQRAGHLEPTPVSIRAALAKKKKTVTLEVAKPGATPRPSDPALPAPPSIPLTEDETRRRDFRIALQKYLEPVPLDHKIEELKTTLGEDITALLGDLAEPFTVVPLAPTLV